MAETNWQKFVRHYKTGGFFYAIYRAIKYIKWLMSCAAKGIDYKQFIRGK